MVRNIIIYQYDTMILLYISIHHTYHLAKKDYLCWFFCLQVQCKEITSCTIQHIIFFFIFATTKIAKKISGKIELSYLANGMKSSGIKFNYYVFAKMSIKF